MNSCRLHIGNKQVAQGKLRANALGDLNSSLKIHGGKQLFQAIDKSSKPLVRPKPQPVVATTTADETTLSSNHLKQQILHLAVSMPLHAKA